MLILCRTFVVMKTKKGQSMYGDLLYTDRNKYRRICYLCKKYNITYSEYISNPEKYPIQAYRNHHNKKERWKHKSLLRNYQISIEEYKRLYEDQNGLCAACSKPETSKTRLGTTRLLCVDHNHKTNKVRGLLCSNCNTAIGLINEDLTILDNIKSYLTQHND